MTNSVHIHDRAHPFAARAITNQRLNQGNSEKDTLHIVFDLKGSGIAFQPGDSLGVFPRNPPHLVEELLQKLHLDGNAPVPQLNGKNSSLREALTGGYILNRANKRFVKALAQKLPQAAPLNTSEEKLGEYIFTRDYVDILNEHPDARFTPEELFALLTPISPRLYSIASSQSKHPDEAHLVVSLVSYTTHGRLKYGLASGYLAKHIPIGETAPIFIQHHRYFHLPEDNSRDIIMVGSGTGVAPYRAFLQQREMDGAKGRNWLFFGDRRQAEDFLYREEWEALQKKGVLTRMDTAFSRDQAHKIYVQDRLRERGKELWQWIQNGAYFYVCGDAKNMAKDVHQALIDIVTKEGSLTPDAAADYVNVTLMKEESRYLRDIY
ncbi:MAG: sulfite reductase subunit alpha [bacterium]